MNGVLKVDTAKLKSTASEFSGTAKEVKTLTDNMVSTVKALSGSVWSGDAATAYVKKFTSLQDDINKIYKMITEHSNDLQTMAQQYETTEKQNQTKANALSANVIV